MELICSRSAPACQYHDARVCYKLFGQIRPFQCSVWMMWRRLQSQREDPRLDLPAHLLCPRDQALKLWRERRRTAWRTLGQYLVPLLWAAPASVWPGLSEWARWTTAHGHFPVHPDRTTRYSGTRAPPLTGANRTDPHGPRWRHTTHLNLP